MALTPSIPAKTIVQVNPSAISEGGNSYNLNGVLFTSSLVFPTRTYASADTVGTENGTTSDAYKVASIYFAGTTISTIKPSTLFMVRYNTADIEAKVIGGSQKSKSLSDLQAIKGTLSVTIDGTAKSGSVDLSTATSWSNGASIIATALGVTCTFNSQLQSFIISSTTAGSASSVGYATGTASDALGLSSNGGATIDNDTTADTVQTAIARLKAYTLNFGGYMLDSTFSEDSIKAFATYNSSQNHDAWFIASTLEQQALIANNSNTLGAWIANNNISDTLLIYGDITESALALGFMASLDFTRQNGRMTLDFRNANGLPARITNEADSTALESNGYAYYGGFATKANRFIFMRNARTSGDFKWSDSYLCQLRLNGQLQNGILTSLVNNGLFPYTDIGINKIRSACQPAIDEMVNFGGIQAGVTLGDDEKQQANTLAGYDVSTLLFTQGWVLIVTLPDASVRAQRGSPICTLLYTDGESIQTINLASVAVL